MAGASRKAEQLKAKEAKQKKIAIVGAVLLLGVLGIQMPKLMHRGGNLQQAAPPPATTTPAVPAVPAGTAAPTDLNPPLVAGGNPTPAASSSALADTDVPPAPGDGQIARFDLFPSKDPFVQQVQEVADNGGASAPAAGPKAPASDGGGIGAGGTTAKPPKTPSGPTEPTTAVARITVDGTPEQLVAGGDFPAASPVFHLVSFTAAEATISVLGGQYESGAATLKLAKGRAVTLVNTADGTRYRIVYAGRAKVPTSSLAAPAPTPSPTVTTPTAPAAPPATTTAPATTTPGPVPNAPTGG